MKRKAVSGIIISVGISLLLLLAAFLSIALFEKNFLEATAENHTVIVDSMKSKLEYSLRYGKTLDNYYGIEDLFDEISQYCSYYDYVFVSDSRGNVLYARSPNGDWDEQRYKSLPSYPEIMTDFQDGEENRSFIEEKEQAVIAAVRDRENALAGSIGLLYHTDSCKSDIRPYINKIYLYSVLCMVGGILLFLLLFLVRDVNFHYKKLLKISLFAFLISAVLLGILCFPVFKSGYQEIADKTAEFYTSYVTDEIQSVIKEGVHYEELYEIEEYFAELGAKSKLVDEIVLTDNPTLMSAPSKTREQGDSGRLIKDSLGDSRSVEVHINAAFIPSRLRTIMVSIFMTVASACMIAGEALIFLISVLTSNVHKKERQNTVGHVRGLSFFFSTFEYMATAFVSIVLVSIYQPIEILGYTIPKPVVMALPLSIEILISMITSYLAGILIQKKGWKKIAVSGTAIMIAGTFLAGMARVTVSFIAAQVVIGVGLGFAKTAIDLYAVFTADAQGESIEQYTSQANAGIMMGFSASSAVGGILAERFGYSGAYIAMGMIGIVVMILFLVFGREAKAGRPQERNAGQTKAKEKASLRSRIQFASYLLLVVVPYFFVMMFVDYFFPVYANQDGISTSVIGYVFLFYGMISSYGGTWLCDVIVKRKYNETRLMMIAMLLVGTAIAAFAISRHTVLLLLVIAVIAVSDGIMPSLQYKYVSELPYTKSRGMEMTVGLEGVFSSGIRGLAPMIFGALMAIGDRSLLLLGGVVCILSVLFYMENHVVKGRGL